MFYINEKVMKTYRKSFKKAEKINVRGIKLKKVKKRSRKQIKRGNGWMKNGKKENTKERKSWKKLLSLRSKVKENKEK